MAGRPRATPRVGRRLARATTVRGDQSDAVTLGYCQVQIVKKKFATDYAQRVDIQDSHRSLCPYIEKCRGAAFGRPIDVLALGPALQTHLQGETGTMLKSADETHVQLVPSRCKM